MTAQRLHPTARAAGNVLRLRILATTDLHLNLMAYDYFADRPCHEVGLSRVGALIREARNEAANCLLLDNGDTLQGTPLQDHLAPNHAGGGLVPHPMIGAMNALGYDAATLGNHDFGMPLCLLEGFVGQAAFPVVCANVVRRIGADPTEDRPFLMPHVVLDRAVADARGDIHRLRIGVIGLLPSRLRVWERERLAGQLEVRGILETLRAHVPLMRAAGADLVVALCHSGIGAMGDFQGTETAAIHVAGVEGVDVVVAGHTHQRFPHPEFRLAPWAQAMIDTTAGTIHGKPVVQPGFWGSHLGVVDLTLNHRDGRWRPDSAEAHLRPIATRDALGRAVPLCRDDPAVVAAGQAAHDATLRAVRRRVGTARRALHTYFSQVGSCPALQLINAAQMWYAAQAGLGDGFGGLPVLSAAAPLKAGGLHGPEHYAELPVGRIAECNIADLYPFPNTLRAVRISGADLRDWMDFAAGAFRQVRPGQWDAPLLDPAFPSYDFDVFAGVDYCIDLARPPRFHPDGSPTGSADSRIRRLRIAGQRVGPEDQLVVLTSDHRIASGYCRNVNPANVVHATDRLIRDILIDYIALQGMDPVAPPPGRWGFVPMAGTSVVFDTGIGAARHILEAHDLRLEATVSPLPRQMRFRLKLEPLAESA